MDLDERRNDTGKTRKEVLELQIIDHLKVYGNVTSLLRVLKIHSSKHKHWLVLMLKNYHPKTGCSHHLIKLPLSGVARVRSADPNEPK